MKGADSQRAVRLCGFVTSHQRQIVRKNAATGVSNGRVHLKVRESGVHSAKAAAASTAGTFRNQRQGYSASDPPIRNVSSLRSGLCKRSNISRKPVLIQIMRQAVQHKITIAISASRYFPNATNAMGHRK